MGTDESLLDKLNATHEKHDYYVMPPMYKPVFSILHYAGTVKYQIKVIEEEILLRIFKD